jgi:hypothetical protein
MTEGLSSIIGDSSLNGWATFFVYLVATWLCARNARASAALAEAGGRKIALARSRWRFWTMLGALLLLLGFSRQFDVQALLAQAARNLLQANNAYEARSGLQIGLVAAIGGFGTIGLVIALVSFRRVERSVLVALAGAAFLVIFTLIRTISLHRVDQVLQQGLGVPHAQVNNLIELGALAVIAAASYAFARGLRGEGEVARLRQLSIQERRRQLTEKRRAARS